MRETQAGSKRVLVIEDYADSAEILRLALESHGHTVEVASSGGEGIEKARALRPDVVICDLGLPDMDGLAVALEIRTDEELKRTWLIALTAYNIPTLATAAGFDQHITKPADLRRLAAQLREDPPLR